jgi:hypothetical protein
VGCETSYLVSRGTRREDFSINKDNKKNVILKEEPKGLFSIYEMI